MKYSRVSQENKTPSTNSGRVGLETVEASINPQKTPENLAGKANPQPPVQPVSERFPALEEQDIILTCYAPDAKEVTVAGNFNNWHPEATPLKTTGAGKWVVRLRLRSGQYEYLFVVDGKWSEDPQASLRVTNPYGAFNSALLVPLEVRTSIL
jgi:hypothetical protein